MFARLKIVSLMATKCDEIDGKSSVNCHLRYDEKKNIDSIETHHERQPVITAETEIVSNKNFRGAEFMIQKKLNAQRLWIILAKGCL